MKQLSDLSGYCPVFDKLNNSLILIGNATKDTIEKFRKKTLYDADDLRDWAINRCRGLDDIIKEHKRLIQNFDKDSDILRDYLIVKIAIRDDWMDKFEITVEDLKNVKP